MSAVNLATCQFCSRPDDSIQVLCESRCLICSRCQLVPVVRKLLIDHCEFTQSGSQPAALNASSQNDDHRLHAASSATCTRGTCPICSGSISQNMLYLIQSYYDSLNTEDDEMLVGFFAFSESFSFLSIFSRFYIGEKQYRSPARRNYTADLCFPKTI